MKSVVEEGATLTKALEKAWNKAGKPNKFFVKILEHPVHAFWGLRSEKSAKVAIFFKETHEQEAPVLGDDILKQQEYAFLFEETSPVPPSKMPKKEQSFKTRPLPKKPAASEQQSMPAQEKQNVEKKQHFHKHKHYYPKHNHKQESAAPKNTEAESGQALQPQKQEHAGRRRYYGRRRYKNHNKTAVSNENKSSDISSEHTPKKQEPDNS